MELIICILCLAIGFGVGMLISSRPSNGRAAEPVLRRLKKLESRVGFLEQREHIQWLKERKPAVEPAAGDDKKE